MVKRQTVFITFLAWHHCWPLPCDYKISKMSHCDLHGKGQITALGAMLKEPEFVLVDLRGQPVNVLSALHSRDKANQYRSVNKIFLLQTLILQEDSHKHICVFLHRWASISERTKVDRGYLHIGSPNLVKSSLIQNLSRLPNHAQCFVLLPQLLGLVTLLQALGQTPTVRHVRLAVFSVPLHHPVFQYFILPLRKWEVLHHLKALQTHTQDTRMAAHSQVL